MLFAVAEEPLYLLWDFYGIRLIYCWVYCFFICKSSFVEERCWI